MRKTTTLRIEDDDEDEDDDGNADGDDDGARARSRGGDAAKPLNSIVTSTVAGFRREAA